MINVTLSTMKEWKLGRQLLLVFANLEELDYSFEKVI